MARENDLVVVSDEIYGHIFYGGAGEGPGGARAPGLFDLDPALLDPARSVVVSGMSKAWVRVAVAI